LIKPRGKKFYSERKGAKTGGHLAKQELTWKKILDCLFRLPRGFKDYIKENGKQVQCMPKIKKSEKERWKKRRDREVEGLAGQNSFELAKCGGEDVIGG